jgi:hypothetical protein
MSALFRLLLSLYALLLAGVAHAEGYRPQPFQARYSVHVNGFKVGEIDRNLHIEADGRYVLENLAYTTGLVALFKKDRALERSTWVYNDDHVKPIEYFAHYTGRSKDVIERLDFDWQRNIVSSLRDGKITEVALVPGTMDKLMHQAVLRGDVAAGMQHIEYPIADRDDIKPYVYDVLGSEEVVTGRGTVRAIKVRKGTTTFWLAPEWDYLLVKLVQENDDSTYASYLQAEK